MFLGRKAGVVRGQRLSDCERIDSEVTAVERIIREYTSFVIIRIQQLVRQIQKIACFPMTTEMLLTTTEITNSTVGLCSESIPYVPTKWNDWNGAARIQHYPYHVWLTKHIRKSCQGAGVVVI
jgi:hypothetical protein